MFNDSGAHAIDLCLAPAHARRATGATQNRLIERKIQQQRVSLSRFRTDSTRRLRTHAEK
jgi:hypothetical protein